MARLPLGSVAYIYLEREREREREKRGGWGGGERGERGTRLDFQDNYDSELCSLVSYPGLQENRGLNIYRTVQAEQPTGTPLSLRLLAKGSLYIFKHHPKEHSLRSCPQVGRSGFEKMVSFQANTMKEAFSEHPQSAPQACAYFVNRRRTAI